MTVRAVPGNLVTEDDMEALDLELERTKAKRAAKRPAASSLGVLTDSTNRNALTPHRPPPSASKTPPTSVLPKTPSSAFHSRSQAGQVIKTLNEHLELLSSKDAEPMDIVGPDRCSIEDLSTGPRPNQKYMANRIADRVVYLERRMMGFAEALEQAHSISATNSLSVPCQEPEWFVGRIVCDSEGHLNASSVLLEGTLQHSQGHSVKLGLSQLPSYRLFPDQVPSLASSNCTLL
ncbi:g7933 [Coccomyxa viridis]|uniref:G7933 protein n=1 Tax=Coccomyxa viridis TaxID=1274662 RepID=A0ABP1FZ76_9CHLO